MGVAIEVSMIGFGVGVENFSTGGTFFISTSFVSSGSQKKENSDSDFRRRDDGNGVTFVGEAISFVSSVSGFQKNDRSETDFVHGVTGEEMTFLGGLIQSFTTCCIGASCDGTDVVVILLTGKGFSMTTS